MRGCKCFCCSRISQKSPSKKDEFRKGPGGASSSPDTGARGRQEEFQMGGPKGALFFALFFTGYTYFVTEKSQSGKWDLLQVPGFNLNWHAYVKLETTLLLLAWFLVQCLLYVLPIGGKIGYGVMLRTSGTRLTYRLNAVFVLCVNVFGLVSFVFLGVRVDGIGDKQLQLLTSGVLGILGLSLILYIRGGQAVSSLLNPAGNTGYSFYDWFMGRELNPRLGVLDIKYVMFRSGIIGWILLNIVNISTAHVRNGTPGMTLLLTSAMQLVYVLDYFWLEEGILVSRDIVHEGLGYNILIQFLMIPFCFAVQTRYLATTNYTLPGYYLLAIGLLNGIGYYIYRASNSEKNNFRKNPNDPSLAHLERMSTSAGKQLLIGGWWGICRHPNYLGDLIISLSYALPTGFNHVMPYLGFFVLVLLLVDREKNDSEHCKKKYGADWDRYCQRVKYRIIPGLY